MIATENLHANLTRIIDQYRGGDVADSTAEPTDAVLAAGGRRHRAAVFDSPPHEPPAAECAAHKRRRKARHRNRR